MNTKPIEHGCYCVSMDPDFFHRIQSGNAPSELLEPAVKKLSSMMSQSGEDVSFRITSEYYQPRPYTGDYLSIDFFSERRITATA